MIGVGLATTVNLILVVCGSLLYAAGKLTELLEVEFCVESIYTSCLASLTETSFTCTIFIAPAILIHDT